MEWHEYIHQLLENESAIDGISLSFGDEQIKATIPPMIKASVSLLDKMQENQGKYNVFVFPEKTQSIFIFALSRLLYNIFEGKIGREYDPTKFEPGERLRLGKAVVEFIAIEERNGLNCMRFRTAESMTVSTPLGLLPFFQRTNTNRKLSKYKQFFEEREAVKIEKNTAKGAEQLLSFLSNYKTHMDSSIFYITSVISAKEMIRNCGLCGHNILEVLLLGQVDYSGKIRNLGAGQLAGCPAIVLAPDLYSVSAAANSGCPAQSVIIDVSNPSVIASQIDQLDELMRLDIPITCVTDTVNSFDLNDLRARGFTVWRWDKDSITDELYDVSTLISDKKSRRCANQNLEYLRVDGLASSEALKALSQHREDSQEQSAQIMKMYEELYSLAFLALRETTPFTSGELDRAQSTLREAAETLSREKPYISSQAYNDYKFAIENLRTIFCADYCPPKQAALADRLQRENYKSVCLIVPDRFDTTHIKDYWQAWCIDHHLQTTFEVLHPGEYYPLSNENYSIAIVVGWIKRAIMRKILYSYNTQNNLVLLYDYEYRWKNHDVRKWGKDLAAQENKTVIKKSFSTDKINISTTYFSEEAEAANNEPDISASDELNEIERVLRENKFRQYIARGGTGTIQSTVEAIPVNYAGGYMAFYRAGHKIISATRIISGDAEEIETIYPSQLSIGDFIVVRESDRDLIKEIADNILRAEGKSGQRSVASKWREALEIESLFSSPEIIYQKLVGAGCTREFSTVLRWLTDEDIIAPQQKQDLQLIAQITDSSVLVELMDQVYDAAKEVKAAHAQAGHILSGKLKARIVQALANYGDIDPFNIWEPIEITIDDIGTAKILKVIDIGSAITVDTADTNRLIEE